MRRVVKVGVSVAIALIVALVFLNDRSRLVGFRYAVVVDNLNDVAPSTVTAVDGSRITLDDGRKFVLKDVSEPVLREALNECERRVRYDPSEGGLVGAQRIEFCGFDFPQRHRLITIPLVRVELRPYVARPFGPATPFRPDATNSRKR